MSHPLPELLSETLSRIAPADPEARKRARARLESLTMPHWAMGRLMDLAEDLAGMGGYPLPSLARKAVVVMAGDHGVVREGVSKYPGEVTPQMVANFVRGGAAVNALADLAGCRVVVVDMGVAADLGSLGIREGVLDRKIRPGTLNMAQGPALTRMEAAAALEAGIGVYRDLEKDVDLFATGDMGIGNTTASAAILSALTGLPPEKSAGRGTGLDDAQFAHKAQVIRRALEVNRPDPKDPLDVLAKVGGLEIAGLAGFILACAAGRKPVLVDGFISSAAALIARAFHSEAAGYMIAAHRSAEFGHGEMLRILGKQPLLDLDMRLGEGTGAVLAMHLVEAASRLLTRVATFSQAGVSGPAA